MTDYLHEAKMYAYDRERSKEGNLTKEQTNAIAYFKDSGIEAYKMRGSIFIVAKATMDVQISTAEVEHRSELYMRRVNEFQYPQKEGYNNEPNT